jgi:hypothetical protein
MGILYESEGRDCETKSAEPVDVVVKKEHPMSSDLPPTNFTRRQRVLVSLRKDFLFWFSLLLIAWIAFLVPQVHDVIFQTAQGSISPRSGQFFRWNAWVPFFYLMYLAVLLTGTAASILFVVPPSLMSALGRSVRPAPPPPFSRAAVLRLVGILLVLALGGILDFTKWLGILYPWLPVILLGELLFPWAAWAVYWSSSWLILAVERWPVLRRRRVAVALILGGLILWALLAGLDVGRRPQFRHPLGLLALHGLGLILCLTGLWLGCFAGRASGKPYAEAPGRLIGWLACAWLAGEVIWFVASLRIGIVEGFAYRLYTVWCVLEVLILIVLVASLLDTWEEAANAPLRLAGLFALALIGLLARMPGTEGLEAPTAVTGGTTPHDWPRHFLARIRQVPPGEPVVLVAASGGGSRAAIFTGLVLEGLAREPFPGAKETTWGDHVVLISGVSGGSLATARFVHRLATSQGQDGDDQRDDLRHSYRIDLVARMKSEASALDRDFRSHQAPKRVANKLGDSIDEKTRTAFFADYQEALRHALDAEGDWDWVVTSAIMDDLSTDFMAPTLRGALIPLLSRGESLRLFWRDQFAWNGSNDRGGYTGGKGDRLPWDRYPLVIFNAADAERGSRLALGFPPLPPGFRMTDRAIKPSVDEEGHHPPQTLADLDPERSIDLHQAVALSANFPFGFEPVTIPRHNASHEAAGRATILDGGITDNSGIDTLFLVLHSLKEGTEALDPLCREIWSELQNRRVLLVEINSGRKPGFSGPASRWLSPLSDPTTARNHARFDHVGLVKRHYLASMHDWLRDRELAELSLQVAEVEKRFATMSHEREDLESKTAPARKRLEQWALAEGDRFTSMRFECTHLGQSNVQTAWSLGPKDKARVLVRFLIEMHLHRCELKQWAAELFPKDTGQALRKDACELAVQHGRALACQLLDRAIVRTVAELHAMQQSRKDLSAGLVPLERLAEAEHMARRFGVRMETTLHERIENLRRAIPLSRAQVGANGSLALLDLDALESARKRHEPAWRQQQKTAQARLAELMPKLGTGTDWQTRFKLRGLLSRELHARVGAGQ